MARSLARRFETFLGARVALVAARARTPAPTPSSVNAANPAVSSSASRHFRHAFLFPLALALSDNRVIASRAKMMTAASANIDFRLNFRGSLYAAFIESFTRGHCTFPNS